MLYTNLVHATREANKWDLRFLKQAAEVSSWSKDPSTKVGAILASQDNQQIVIGYNGYPSRLADNQHEHTREERLARSIHAELNAIFNAKRPLSSYRMYVYGHFFSPRQPYFSCWSCSRNSSSRRFTGCDSLHRLSPETEEK